MASTDWKEIIPDGEAENHERFGAIFGEMQKARAAGRNAERVLHVKTNGGLLAKLRVKDDVPEDLRVGVFAEPGKTYEAYARFSNGGMGRQHDKTEDVRGIALKVLGVPGKKLIPGLEGATTQDFLLIRSATTPVRTTAEFIALVSSVRRPALLPILLATKLGIGRTFQILKLALAGMKAPTMPLAATTYYSVLPMRWGDHGAKLVLVPRETPPATAPPRKTLNALGDALAERLVKGPVTYDLQVQLFVDEASTPIEDPTVEWKSPARTVAEVQLEQQDPASERGQKIGAYIEDLSFDPWHAPVEFRPLGEMMRARSVAYRVSTTARKATPEPVEAIPSRYEG